MPIVSSRVKVRYQLSYQLSFWEVKTMKLIRGFTLVELLIVVLIFGALTAIALLRIM